MRPASSIHTACGTLTMPYSAATWWSASIRQGRSVARAIWALDAAGAHGIHHWTDAGVASWYDFAVAIRDEATAAGLLDRAVAVVPIKTSDYPTPAKRPAMSLLDKSSSWAITGPAAHWRAELKAALAEMVELRKDS